MIAQTNSILIIKIRNQDPVRALQHLLRGIQLNRADLELREMTKGLLEHWDAVLGEKSERLGGIKSLLESLLGEMDVLYQDPISNNEEIIQEYQNNEFEIYPNQSFEEEQSFAPTENLMLYENYNDQLLKYYGGSWENDNIPILKKRPQSAKITRFSLSAQQKSSRPSSATGNYYGKKRKSSSLTISANHKNKKNANDILARKLSETYIPKVVAQAIQSDLSTHSRPSSAKLKESNTKKIIHSRPQSAAGISVNKSLTANSDIPHIPSQHYITDIILRKEEASFKKTQRSKSPTKNMSPKKSSKKRPASAMNRRNTPKKISNINTSRTRKNSKLYDTISFFKQDLSFKDGIDKKKRQIHQNQLIEQLREHLQLGSYKSEIQNSEINKNTSILHNPEMVEENISINEDSINLSLDPIKENEPLIAMNQNYIVSEEHELLKNSNLLNETQPTMKLKSKKALHNRKSIFKKSSQKENRNPEEIILSNDNEYNLKGNTSSNPTSIMEKVIQMGEEAIRLERLRFLKTFSYPGLVNHCKFNQET